MLYPYPKQNNFYRTPVHVLGFSLAPVPWLQRFCQICYQRSRNPLRVFYPPFTCLSVAESLISPVVGAAGRKFQHLATKDRIRGG